MVRVGDRVQLIEMPDEPDAIPPGTQGVVDYINEVTYFRPPFTQIGVKWDNGRTLMMSVPPDVYVVVD